MKTSGKGLGRRSFLKRAGAGIPALGLLRTTETPHRLPDFSYGGVSLEDATNAAREVCLRIEFTSTEPRRIVRWAQDLRLTNANGMRVIPYFFEPVEDVAALPPAGTRRAKFEGLASARSSDVLLLYVQEASEATSLQFTAGGEPQRIVFKALVDQGEFRWEDESSVITANLLSQRELGKVSLDALGIPPPKDPARFRFAIFADPQGGEPDAPRVESPTRMKIHNAFIEESIRRINELDLQPLFSIVNGDFVDSKGQRENFERMLAYFSSLKSPLLLELGNHETAYSSVFGPGYNMEAFNEYFAAQKALNGLEKLLYSFDVGNWHFVVWPDPLRNHFWQTHPHYFEWLKEDLAQHRTMPTIFVHHVPLHPIGINPLINYVEGPEVKRMLLDLLAAHGNVKYVFSGHVHIPFRASLKTARTYKGMNLINLPAAGYRPRAFGEPDLDGGPSQGAAYVDILGEEVQVFFKTVTDRTFVYPNRFSDFEPDEYPLWLTHPWELPANEALQNGRFEQGLAHWHRRYVYQEDEQPSNRIELRRNTGSRSFQALYLYTRTRAYMAPGQDRLPQTLNRICQAVRLAPNQRPHLRFRYQVDPANFHPEAWCGAYVWVEGYTRSHKMLNLLYAIGKSPSDPGGKYSKSFQAPYVYWDLPATPGSWQQAALLLDQDYHPDHGGTAWDELQLDRLIIHLGTWTQNDRESQAIGVYFDDVELAVGEAKQAEQSSVNGQPIALNPLTDRYHKRVDHVSGEHILKQIP